MLVIEQKPKFVELTNEYRVLDEAGNEIGVIRQEGQSKARKILRLVTSVDRGWIVQDNVTKRWAGILREGFTTAWRRRDGHAEGQR